MRPGKVLVLLLAIVCGINTVVASLGVLAVALGIYDAQLTKLIVILVAFGILTLIFASYFEDEK